MKKLSLFLAAVSMLWLLSACGGQPQADASTSIPEAAASQPATPSATTQPVQDNGPLEQGNILIAYGGREVYGGIEQAITVEGEGQLCFDDGDITYCPSNNTAAIFYSQSDRPNLTMTVYPIGKVTSDLSIFPNLPSRVEITFEVISK